MLTIEIPQICKFGFNMAELDNSRRSSNPFVAIVESAIIGAGVTGACKDAFFLERDGMENVFPKCRLQEATWWILGMIRKMEKGGFVSSVKWWRIRPKEFWNRGAW